MENNDNHVFQISDEALPKEDSSINYDSTDDIPISKSTIIYRSVNKLKEIEKVAKSFNIETPTVLEKQRKVYRRSIQNQKIQNSSDSDSDSDLVSLRIPQTQHRYHSRLHPTQNSEWTRLHQGTSNTKATFSTQTQDDRNTFRTPDGTQNPNAIGDATDYNTDSRFSRPDTWVEKQL